MVGSLHYSVGRAGRRGGGGGSPLRLIHLRHLGHLHRCLTFKHVVALTRITRSGCAVPVRLRRQIPTSSTLRIAGRASLAVQHVSRERGDNSIRAQARKGGKKRYVTLED